jgi:hypothetical protein
MVKVRVRVRVMVKVRVRVRVMVRVIILLLGGGAIRNSFRFLYVVSVDQEAEGFQNCC